MSVIELVDVVAGQGATPALQLTWSTQTVTGREIIRRRVIEEVERYNRAAATGPDPAMLVPAPQAEFALNGQRPTGRVPLDVDNQIEVALAACKSRRIIMMFNGTQVDDLDSPLLVTPVSEARFIRLVHLVGG